jgi:uncharacterized protein YegP (UPF0339 family)
MADFQVYTDSKGEYRWFLIADTRDIIADSSKGYVQKSDCEREIELVKCAAADAPVDDLTKLTQPG